MEKVTSTIEEVRERLEQHHQRMESLAATVRLAGVAEERSAALAQFMAFLALHDEVLRRLLHGQAPVDEPATGEAGNLGAAAYDLQESPAGGPQEERLQERLDAALRRHQRFEADGLAGVGRSTSPEQWGELHRVLDLVTQTELSEVAFPAGVPYEQVQLAARREVDTMLTQLR